MILYRVEDIYGYGVYRTRLLINKEEYYYDSRRPIPENDGLPLHTTIIYDNYIFGFKSEEQLLNWFPEYIEEFDTLYCAQYLVNEKYLLFGGRQVMFKKELASLQYRISMRAFYKKWAINNDKNLPANMV